MRSQREIDRALRDLKLPEIRETLDYYAEPMSDYTFLPTVYTPRFTAFQLEKPLDLKYIEIRGRFNTTGSMTGAIYLQKDSLFLPKTGVVQNNPASYGALTAAQGLHPISLNRVVTVPAKFWTIPSSPTLPLDYRLGHLLPYITTLLPNVWYYFGIMGDIESPGTNLTGAYLSANTHNIGLEAAERTSLTWPTRLQVTPDYDSTYGLQGVPGPAFSLYSTRGLLHLLAP